jgi:hypothetical protein
MAIGICDLLLLWLLWNISGQGTSRQADFGLNEKNIYKSNSYPFRVFNNLAVNAKNIRKYWQRFEQSVKPLADFSSA